MRKLAGCFMLLLAVAFAAEVMTFDNNWAETPLFSVVTETPSGVELVFSTQRVVVDERPIDGVLMKTYGVPGIFLPRDEGAPNLAGTARYIAIPQGAQVQVTVLDSRAEVFHNVEVAPAPNIPIESDNTPLRYEKDMKLYSRNAYYPEHPVTVSAPEKIRGVDVVLVGVTPFQYNPVTKELVVYKDLRIRIDFIGGNGHIGEDRLRSRFWETILRAHILNYRSLPVIDFYAPERTQRQTGFEYIIIVPDDPVFEAWGDTIKRFRKEQGISCEVYTLTEVGGSSSSAIEGFLNTAYSTWDPAPVAFLILSDYPSSGDVYGITAPQYSGCVSDNIYADVDGNDLPDMHHARICAQSDAQLNIMINKFLDYERNPYTASNFYDNPLVACGWQTDRWFQICIEVIRGFFINEQGRSPARQYDVCGGTPSPGCAWSTNSNTSTIVAYFGSAGLGYIPDTNPYDYSWWTNGSASGINAAINSGAFLVQHRDHGEETGWGDPAYHNSDLSGLSNSMLPFVISTNCLTGIYNWASTCFAEAFHRMNGGALGLNAATQLSYSFVNDTYVWGLYDCLFQEFMPDYPTIDMTGSDLLRPCMAMTYGKYFLAQSSWPSNPGSKAITYHLFHHHSDAFVTLYSQVPQSLSVSHASSLQGGVTSFTVTADDGSVIALTVDGEIIGVAAGTGSPVNITIPGQNPGDVMKVVVTKANYYRYDVDVPVVSSSYPYVVFSIGYVDDSAGNGDGFINPGESIDYSVWAKNVGTGTAQGVYGLLSESDTYVTVITDSSWYGNIPEDDSVLSTQDYEFDVATNCPDGHSIDFTLEFYDTNDSVFMSYFSLVVCAPVLTFENIAVVGGNGNGILDPDETADLVLTIENEGGAMAPSVTSTIVNVSSSYVTVNDGSGSFGSIDPGNTADNSSDPYNVTADPSTPTGTVVTFDVELTAGVYVDTISFDVVVGRKHYYLWNPDPTSTPGENMHSIATGLGFAGDYGTALAPDLSLYQAVLVCVGIYSSNFVIDAGSPEAAALVDFVQNQGGRMYLEGGDVWFYDPPYQGGYDFGPLFGINATDDGSSDMGPVVGESGTFTESMTFAYGGENSWMDHIDPTGTGYLIFHDSDDGYNCGVANDAGTYRTVGTSFELGLLTDGSGVSTREQLIYEILTFFGCQPNPGVEEDLGFSVVPMETRMSGLMPNPVIGRAMIRYQLAKQANVHLEVFDAAGRLVRTLADGAADPGYYSVLWDGNDAHGRSVSAGVYFVHFNTSDYHTVEKAVLIR